MAGKKVAATAGKYLKKCVLELGGSDPFIVLADADVAKAAEVAAKARTINTGQSCIAAKRFIVEESVADEFERVFSQKLASLKMGDPMDESTELGTIARDNLRDELHDQVARSKEQGAKVVLGGKIPEGQGAFYPATVVSGKDQDIPVFAEETFGPVAAVVRVKDADEAVAVANNSRYGLGGSLWTQDLEKGKGLAARIETGSVFINGMTKSDPRLPFCGIKKSGFGRELSHYGIKEFVNIQTIWVG
jgi:succinate-semialdehyde dehydrogenase/glutarate-semialdehyde dehydrogenase